MAKSASIQHDGRKSYTAAQGNEPERRGWNEDTYRLKNLDTNNHYDWSRHSLNFEVTKGGKITALGSHSRPLTNRLYDRLHDLGWKEYKQGADNAPNCIIDLVFSGDREIMRRMAFAEQDVCYDLSRKNTNVQRMPEIEKWAIDTYNWCCRKYGAENVVGFQVHLDETNPHAQAQVIPVAEMKQRGRLKPGEERKKKDTVSYYGVVGMTREDRKTYMENLHTDYHLQVGYKYGLERGKFFADLTEEEKKRRKKGHLSKEDLDRENKQQALLKQQEKVIGENTMTLEELNRQIKRAEIKIKGLDTMIKNLEQYQQQLEPISQEYEELTAKLQKRQKQLDSAKNELAELEEEKNELLSNIVEFVEEKEQGKKLLDKVKDDFEDLMDRKANAQHQYDDIQRSIRKAEHQYDDIQQAIRRDLPILEDRVIRDCQAMGWKMAVSESRDTLDRLNQHLRALSQRPMAMHSFEEAAEITFFGNILGEMAIRGEEIATVAGALFLGYLDQATAFAQANGGGGSSPDSGWGRRPDEDDEAFRARCFLMARMMMRAPGRSQQQSRGPKR